MTLTYQPSVELIAADPSRTVLAFDFDGTLAPIVDNPENARANETAVRALAQIAPAVGAVVIITGRPVAQALELGGFEHYPGLEQLVIYGQYGAERWSARSGHIEVTAPAPQLARVRDHLPLWLAEHDASEAFVEDKGLALAVHTRGLDAQLLDRLVVPLERIAAENRLRFEPGRQVLELRTPGIDKGNALHAVVENLAARTVIFAGDDLGDLPAFDAVDELRDQGLNGLLVCSASDEQDALAARSDLVVDGPDGIAEWLCAMVDGLDCAHDVPVCRGL